MQAPSISSLAVILLSLIFMPASFAAQTIDWDGLVPAVDESRDPYERLSEDQQDSLYDLWMVRASRDAGSDNPDLDVIESEAIASLKADGIDAGNLLQELDEFLAILEANKNRLVEDLDGKNVRLPGYVLPTEFSGSKIVEFLLVPYVGACIHTPPPPPNQMVHVVVDEGFTSTGLFQPVWVTGQISTEISTQAVSLSDGALDVQAGYRISADNILPYE